MQQATVGQFAVVKQHFKYEPVRENTADAGNRHKLKPRASADRPDDWIHQVLDHNQRDDNEKFIQQIREAVAT
ncbi:MULTISPECIES: hypothetical protein [Burkholderia]|uniref:hypothetical protein n=1 Tax=Burkholderia TaxID=32008 RepID=UPI00211AC79F|nr:MULTISPECIES: hypothetical protein [Burkholderia]